MCEDLHSFIHMYILCHHSCYKKNYLKRKEKTSLSKFVTIDAGIQLDKKEKIDEDGKPLSSLAATNPLPQETTFCM